MPSEVFIVSNAPNGGTSKQFFTLKEAAAYVGVTRKTLYLWTKRPRKDRPPIIKLSPNCVRVPVEDFIKWINSKMENQ